MTARSILTNIIAVWALALATNNQIGVTALPTGASACPFNEAAVGGAHLTMAEILTGSLSNSSSNLQVLLNGEPLSTDGPTDVPIGVDHTLELVSSATPFRGFLFRLGSDMEGSVDTTAALSVSDADAASIQVADLVCLTNEDVGGLTHTNNVEKTSVKGILRLDEAASALPLDVTVVIRNQSPTSEYFYTQFTLNAVVDVAPEEGGTEGDGESSARRRAVAVSTMLALSSLFSLALVL